MVLNPRLNFSATYDLVVKVPHKALLVNDFTFCFPKDISMCICVFSLNSISV
jgi:hypothetical protein